MRAYLQYYYIIVGEETD